MGITNLLFLFVVLITTVSSYVINEKKAQDLQTFLNNIETRRHSARVSFKECNLDDGLREDCGFYGITEEACYKRECCWDESQTPGVPWCYHSKPTITRVCTMHVDERMECGYYGIRKEQCMAHGCCWQPTNQDRIPWCFEIKRIPIHVGECGLPAIPPIVQGARVVGGTEAKPHSWPWQVSVQSGSHFCGGSIINENWIMTAAHCEPGFEWGSGARSVAIGLHKLSEVDRSIQEIEVEHIIHHERYDGNNNDNDVMLLKLKQPLSFSDWVSPVCLPHANESFASGLRCYTTGWGNLMAGGSSPDELQQVMIPLIGRDICNQEGWYGGVLTENMICAGFEEGGRDSCQGDSGGPLVCYHESKWKLLGVVSWGYGCADERKPGIYSNVVNYIDWIQNKVSRYS